MKGIDAAAARLADAIARAARRSSIVADYDADGATACAVGGARARRDGRRRRFSRAEPVRVRLRADAGDRRRWPRAMTPRLIVTVDNGIASHEGVAAAAALGIEVLITDHHLPGRNAARARAHRQSEPARMRVSGQAPRRRRRHVLRAARDAGGAARARRLRRAREPNLGALLDLVALGTVADVVRLDRINRTLVAQGLARIRAGRAQPGHQGAVRGRGRDPRGRPSYDLGFVAGPRLNAAGRLSDMAVGIRCLLADDRRRRRCRWPPSSTG